MYVTNYNNNQRILSLFSLYVIFMTILITSAFSQNLSVFTEKKYDTNRNTHKDSLLYATVSLNGNTTGQLISYLQRGENILLDSQIFFPIVGGKYFPFVQNYGLTVQYGKIISFAVINNNYGFVACQKIEMVPPAEIFNNTVMAPVNFLMRSIDGSIKFIKADQHLDITVEEPEKIGERIPEAKNLETVLSQKGYIVQQGSINLANAIEFCSAGYSPDCNGNNANFPYLVIQSPPCPAIPFVYSIPITFSMRPDEAIIIIGRTPPQCAYFSYRSYLMNRYYEDESPHRVKLYASLGDTKNLYNLNDGRTTSEVFQRFFLLISTADANMEKAIREAGIQSGIDENNIYIDVIPSDIVRMGLEEKADLISFLHRVSLVSEPNQKELYLTSPPLEVLRLTPEEQLEPDYIPMPKLRTRGSGTTEFFLNAGFEQLVQKIIQKYSSKYRAIQLRSSVWLMEGLEAIQSRTNVIGETRDALYLRSEEFEFFKDDIIIVCGVNHTKTNKAIYCNVSCYGAEKYNGLGGITNREYAGTAHEYLSDSLLADYFYVWKFARDSLDAFTFVVPQDPNHTFTGINYGAKSFMGFRAYVEPSTKVGPAPWEVIMDQAILLRPLNTNIEGHKKTLQNNCPNVTVFPNPFNSRTSLQITCDVQSDIKITVFNLQGKLVKELYSATSFLGTKEIFWNGNDSNNLPVSSGVYFFRLIHKNRYSKEQDMIVRKVLLVR
ncbi:T9SS type A sorting domain-containing protein [candidate division KSB1 bacterium]|nr:T9SS type A sorting domain-containing protein [candidate division KSB1 bacterium]